MDASSLLAKKLPVPAWKLALGNSMYFRKSDRAQVCRDFVRLKKLFYAARRSALVSRQRLAF